MVLTEVAEATGGLPQELAPAWGPVQADQRRRTSDLLMAWRTAPCLSERLWRSRPPSGRGASPRPCAAMGGRALQLRCHSGRRGSRPCRGTPLSRDRRSSFSWRSRQTAARDQPLAAASRTEWRRFGHYSPPMARRTGHGGAPTTVHENPVPTRSLPGPLLSWYVDAGSTVDQAHRRFEVARNDLRILGALEAALTAARLAYEQWLDATLLAFTSAVETSGFRHRPVRPARRHLHQMGA